jgi:hypothetical protein
VLEIEGPGAAVYMDMEAGEHRLRRAQRRNLRARLDVVEKGPTPGSVPPTVAAARHRTRFGLRATCRGQAQLPGRGAVIEFLGRDRETLAHLIRDLEQAWQKPEPAGPEPARIYGEDGSGVRDPRTGVTVPRLKEVLRGRLDAFLEGWRRATP